MVSFFQTRVMSPDELVKAAARDAALALLPILQAEEAELSTRKIAAGNDLERARTQYAVADELLKIKQMEVRSCRTMIRDEILDPR